MKSIQEVERFFETDIKPRLGYIEEWREKTRKKYLKVNAGCALPIIIFILFFTINFIIYLFKTEESMWPVIVSYVFFLVLMMLPVAGYYVIRKNIREKSSHHHYNTKFKQAIITKLVKFMDEGITYRPFQNVVSGEEFLGGELFEHTIYYPLGYKGEDFFEGKIGETKIKFYEINGRNVEFTKPNTYDGTVEKISFLGFFMVADFNKSFNGRVLVLPETHIKTPEWIRSSGREAIRMDDPEFESLFSVYGNDPVLAHYVLSTSLMSRITRFSRKLNKKIRLSFLNNKLYIAIPHTVNQFEIDLNKSVYDFERIREFYDDIKIAWDIVEELNLNTRIWSNSNGIKLDPEIIPTNYRYRKRWLFMLLAITLGYTGIHYFYAGYYGKGIRTFLICFGVGAFLIHGMYYGRESLRDLHFVLAYIAGFLGFLLVWGYASWLQHDSRGIPMTKWQRKKKNNSE